MKQCAHPHYWILLSTFVAVVAATGARQTTAAVRLPHLIGDHMVLQCGKQVPLWGWAEPGERITITLGDQTITSAADDSGKWSASLEPLAASPEPRQLTFRGSSGSTVTVADILVGEVWIGSGQSNMVMELPADRRKSPPPTIRVFHVAMQHALQPVDDVDGEWVIASFDSLAKFSWVFFEFGRNLHEALHVPVGLIQSTWGGTPIQGWTPASAFVGEPLLAEDLNSINNANAEYEQALKQYEAGRTARQKTPAAATTAPARPQHPFSNPGAWPGHPTILYNAMIHPLAPYAIRGFLWYQGENNVFDARPEIYGTRMKAMIGSWRALWGQNDLPFYYVQLPPFHYKTAKLPLSLTRLWRGQIDALDMVPNTAMAPMMDLGDVNDIHPGKKDEVARRLSLIALNQTYGQRDIVCSGPMYESHVIESARIRVRFKCVGSGLISRDQRPLTWFQLAGDDGNFLDADAKIDGDSVLVSSPQISKPSAVRFGWSNIAEPNLANKEGLPPLPFSTQRW